jgi:integrase
MKAGKEHRVPLSDAALAVLKAVAMLRDPERGDWVFPGSKPGTALNNMAILMMVRRMKHRNLTVHGLRSTFRDWCAEATNYPREIAETALAHTLRDETERAYQRGDLLKKRRELMKAWADFCSRPLPAEEADDKLVLMTARAR